MRGHSWCEVGPQGDHDPYLKCLGPEASILV